MTSQSRTEPMLVAENKELHARLAEAEEMLRAIRGDEVDALLVESGAGPLVYTLQGVDAASNRMRGEILAHISDSVISTDCDQRITYINAAAERQYGVRAATTLGKSLSSVYQCLWLDAAGEDGAAAALRERGEWRGENIHLTHDGRRLFVESSVTTQLATVEHPAGVLAVIRDVSDRKQVEDRLRVSETRYRRLFEAAQDGVLLLDADTCKITDANPFMTRLLDYPRDQLIGKQLFEIGLLTDEVASREMLQELKRAHRVRYENLPLKSRDGRSQEVEVVANLYDEGGVSVIQFNIRDITERRRIEEHTRMLTAEVNHRARNLLAVVLAVAQQTARGSSPENFVARLSERIQGLAGSQDLLVESQWQGVEMTALVETQLAHFSDLFGGRVLYEGPAARLTSAAAQGVGMALHELATNAGKYGALSNGEGRVRVVWQIAPGDKPAFSMRWLEEGGPEVVAPVRKGFGQVVIGRMLETAVNGSVEIDYQASGLSWRLSAAVADILENETGGGPRA